MAGNYFLKISRPQRTGYFLGKNVHLTISYCKEGEMKIKIRKYYLGYVALFFPDEHAFAKFIKHINRYFKGYHALSLFNCVLLRISQGKGDIKASIRGWLVGGSDIVCFFPNALGAKMDIDFYISTCKLMPRMKKCFLLNKDDFEKYIEPHIELDN